MNILLIAGVSVIIAAFGIHATHHDTKKNEATTQAAIVAKQKEVSKKPNSPREQYKAILTAQGVQITQVGQIVHIIIPSDVVFNSASANTKDSSKKLLSEVSSYIQTFTTTKIEVGAYTDNINKALDPATVTALTTQQAEAVSSALWGNGVDSRMIYAKGYGTDNPISTDDTAKGAYENRRIDISFQFIPKYKNYN